MNRRQNVVKNGFRCDGEHTTRTTGTHVYYDEPYEPRIIAEATTRQVSQHEYAGWLMTTIMLRRPLCLPVNHRQIDEEVIKALTAWTEETFGYITKLFDAAKEADELKKST